MALTGYALRLAIKHLQDNDPNVQLVAVDVLSRVSRTGDKNAVAALVSQLTGHMTKDPTQPGAFLNGADPQKRSLGNRIPVLSARARGACAWYFCHLTPRPPESMYVSKYMYIKRDLPYTAHQTPSANTPG